jgi:hypothetical protein
MGAIITEHFKPIGSLLQKAGPYLLLEILLPGGTLFALLLFVYQRRQQPGAAEVPGVSVVVAWVIRTIRPTFVFVMELSGIASVWRGRDRERDGLEALAMAPVA